MAAKLLRSRPAANAAVNPEVLPPPHLVGPDLVAALQAALQQRLDAALKLHRRGQLRKKQEGRGG